MYELILDSATKKLYVALIKDNDILSEEYIEGRNDHAKNIVDVVDKMLKKNNIDSFKLDSVIVGYGPGSYTGVRMAVTVGKMLAAFAKVKLYTISTLKLMASGAKSINLVKIDARRGNSFATIIDINKNEYILSEAMYENEFLDSKEYSNIVTEDNFKVDPIYVSKNKELVKEPDLLVPNYLRETEAERNLHD